MDYWDISWSKYFIKVVIFYQSMIKLSQKDMLLYTKLYGDSPAEIYEIPNNVYEMLWKSHMRGRILRIQVWFKVSLIFPNYWYQSRAIKWGNMKIPEGFKLWENIIWNTKVSFYLRQFYIWKSEYNWHDRLDHPESYDAIKKYEHSSI
jgi:hypothetical protein